jgi:hypothetical protein
MTELKPYKLSLVLLLLLPCYLSVNGAIGNEGPISSAPENRGRVARIADSLNQFSNRSRSLHEIIRQQESLSYLEAISYAYAEGSIDSTVLRKKEIWRQGAKEKGATFASDYTNLSFAAKVVSMPRQMDTSSSSFVTAEYEARQNEIRLSTQATDEALYHEAGHVLQRASICGSSTSMRQFSNSSYEISSSLEALQKNKKSENTRVERLTYLLNQEEFEVRLQDLNRFYSCMEGSLIMDSYQALQALMILGVEFESGSEKAALEKLGIYLNESDFLSLRKHLPPVPNKAFSVFADARELVVIQQLSLQLYPELWPQILHKILLEAPGHL